MARTITRWNPSADLAEMRSRFDRLVTDLTDGGDRHWMPSVDVIAGDEQLVVRAELPGIKPDETEIQVQDGVLMISGKHEDTEETEHEHFVRRERRYGAFARTLPLPKGVDPDAIEATTRDGVLEIIIPLPEKTDSEPVKITPKAG